ncbi:MAG: L,D-transpeptidase [Gammaproteobacteria bacterium]|nr:L,D-transpeptidase [Gammaproteobacteria bacterium]MCY4228738.1 L,D-transpeptidase [Gammaproteobacteria bacterium]MCY4313755.1 L,D-transpeptidase [Gammaproteobacteria bacterium]
MTGESTIGISISNQALTLHRAKGKTVRTYPVSTAKNGPGQLKDSYCTPLGKHVIRAKIGDGQLANTVFRARRPTGETYRFGMREAEPERDWILTRILWLSGLEVGYNRLGNVDTMRRYIYIHGCPDDVDLGQPGSRGCIRMSNVDVIDLFDSTPVGTPVLIHA